MNANNTVRLQSVGWVAAKPAKTLVVGDRIAYNFGYVYEVLSITPSASGKTLMVKEANVETGEIFDRKFGAERLVAMAS